MKALVLFIVLCAFCFTSCLNNKRIEITTEYIINENWKIEWSNSLYIDRMKVKKDSSINPFSDPGQGELLSKLEEDSSFSWFANANTSTRKEEIYRTQKVYFNQDNGFEWLDDVKYPRPTTTIGSLETNNWYRFSGLVGYPYFVYIYVDSASKTHRFDANVANW
jgi:hypothetical protein